MVQTVQDKVNILRNHFASGATRSLVARRKALDMLELSIRTYEEQIRTALKSDLGKSPHESFMTEIGLVLSEIKFVRRSLAGWMKPERRRTVIAQFPAKAQVLSQPYGVVLIMSPWNYPFQLSMIPLIGAIAAGNCVLLKPSASSPATSAVMEKILVDLPHGLTAMVQGGRTANQDLLEQTFDYLFFTGSPAVGKEVLKSAARDLTPFTLELGGKSPCIVDDTADLRLSARRILFGKLLNAGQTCVAPDFILVHERVKQRLVDELIRAHQEMLPPDYGAKHWGHIVSAGHFERLESYLQGQSILFEAPRDAHTLQFGLTLVDEPDPESALMQEEIFGPILPILSFTQFDEVKKRLDRLPPPIALYLFSHDREHQRIAEQELVYGSGCFNDTMMQLATAHLPFGGVGNSGMGRYHGKASFDTFSNKKSLLIRGRWPDINLRYHPFRKPNSRPPEMFF